MTDALLERHSLRNMLLRKSLSAFIQKTFGVVSAGDPYLHNWHIDLIAQYLEACYRGDIKRLIINIPPRYLKSICASVAFPAWLLGQDPTRKIVSVSYSNDLALKHSTDCKQTMESAFYREIFPATRISRARNTQTEYATTGGGIRLATSVGGTLTGLGGDFIILDDPLKPMDALSDANRKAVNDWFDSTLYSRLNDKKNGCIIIVMQRLHQDDLVGHVLGQEEWVHLTIPALADARHEFDVRPHLLRPYKIIREPGDALHPRRETAAQLLKLKTDIIGSYVFASQYQQEPAPVGGGIIKWAWFRKFSELPEEKPDRVIQSWDTASKAEEAHDYSVCTTWHEYKRGYYLVDIFRQRLEFPDLRRAILSQAEKYKPNAILIEDKGSGIHLIQDLQQTTKLSVISYDPPGDKLTRMMAQTPKIEAGRVLIPDQAAWLSEFELEVTRFPNAKYDDEIDSMSQALDWIGRPMQEWGFGWI